MDLSIKRNQEPVPSPEPERTPEENSRDQRQVNQNISVENLAEIIPIDLDEDPLVGLMLVSNENERELPQIIPDEFDDEIEHPIPEYVFTKVEDEIFFLKRMRRIKLHEETAIDNEIIIINKQFEQYESSKTELQIKIDKRSDKFAQMVSNLYTQSPINLNYPGSSVQPENRVINDTTEETDVKPLILIATNKGPTTSNGNHSKNRRSYSKQNVQDDTCSDSIKIGPNGTRVSQKLISSINWNDVNSATRNLLMIIFDRDTLASHSLTGRPSPAFIEKNNYVVKNKLEEKKINDIIYIVTTKCNASEKHVRQAITIKLADEQKMKKQRDQRALIADKRRSTISKD